MPEGDTIWRAARALNQALKGKRITDVRPETFRRLKGDTVTEVKPVGKHLVIRFESGLAIHSHMRMQGAWHIYEKDEHWRRPAWQLKAMLETADAIAACFGAPVVELIRDEDAKLGHLGPDILTDAWNAQEVAASARRQPATPIGELLLDQRVTAGIGNVYRCEALWQRCINPWSAVGTLTEEQLIGVLETAHDAMRANIADRAQPYRRRFPGYGRGAVHGRGGRPCPRCATAIRVKAQGEHARLTYWCPRCQPDTTRAFERRS